MVLEFFLFFSKSGKKLFIEIAVTKMRKKITVLSVVELIGGGMGVVNPKKILARPTFFEIN